MSISDDALSDVELVCVRAGAATESHLLTVLFRAFGMNADRARTALRVLAEAGRIERRVATNNHVTYWTRPQPARASA